MEEILPRLEALLAYTRELEHRLAGAGVGGLEATVALYRRLAVALDAIPMLELGRIVASARTLAADFAALAGALGDIRRLKAIVER